MSNTKKTKVTISVDTNLLSAVNASNRSRYFEDLMRADVMREHKGSLTSQMLRFLKESDDFENWVSGIAYQQAESVVRKASQGQYP